MKNKIKIIISYIYAYYYSEKYSKFVYHTTFFIFFVLFFCFCLFLNALLYYLFSIDFMLMSKNINSKKYAFIFIIILIYPFYLLYKHNIPETELKILQYKLNRKIIKYFYFIIYFSTLVLFFLVSFIFSLKK